MSLERELMSKEDTRAKLLLDKTNKTIEKELIEEELMGINTNVYETSIR